MSTYAKAAPSPTFAEQARERISAIGEFMYGDEERARVTLAFGYGAIYVAILLNMAHGSVCTL